MLRLPDLDLIGTIDEDQEVPEESESDSGGEEDKPIVLSRRKQKQRTADFNEDFFFAEQGEEERKMLKEIVKKAQAPVKARILPQDVISKFRDKIEKLEKDIYAVLQLEKEEREMQKSETQISVAQRKLQPGADATDDAPRPDRSWFQTKDERKKDKLSKALQEFDLALRGKKKRKKFMEENKKKAQMTPEERSQFEVLKAQMYAERVAKRDRRPKRARAMPEDEPKELMKKDKRKHKHSVFDEELTNTSNKALKQYRAGPSFEDRKRLGIPQKKQGGGFKSKSRYRRK